VQNSVKGSRVKKTAKSSFLTCCHESLDFKHPYRISNTARIRLSSQARSGLSLELRYLSLKYYLTKHPPNPNVKARKKIVLKITMHKNNVILCKKSGYLEPANENFPDVVRSLPKIQQKNCLMQGNNVKNAISKAENAKNVRYRTTKINGYHNLFPIRMFLGL
jgi:hypothetical protein